MAASVGGEGAWALPVGNCSPQIFLQELAAVTLAEEAILGSLPGENVRLPVLGRIPSPHAVLIRDRQGRQIVVLRDRHGEACPMSVDGYPVREVVRLHDGAVVTQGECA